MQRPPLMKNYRELQVCLARSLEGVNSERARAEQIYNGLVRHLIAYLQIPKKCVFFAQILDGQAPVVAEGAKDLVFVNSDRAWWCNFVLRIHETGPRARRTHVVLEPQISFREGEVFISIANVDLASETAPHQPDGPIAPVVEILAEMITEAAMQRIQTIAGIEDRKHGFSVD